MYNLQGHPFIPAQMRGDVLFMLRVAGDSDLTDLLWHCLISIVSEAIHTFYSLFFPHLGRVHYMAD